MRPRTRQRASTIFPIPFAWAATVILAVGAGWMGRELVLNQRLAGSDQAAVMMESSEAERQLSQDEAPPSPAGATAAGDAAGTLGGRVDGPATSAGRAEARQDVRERPAAEPAAAFAPPPAALKAAVSPPTVADERRQAIQIESGLRLQAAPPFSDLAARVALAREYDLDTATTDDARLLRAYLVATRDFSWRPDEVASFGLIGYEATARLDSAETVSAERANADDIELLRTVFVVDGDTVELVQQLRQMAVALDEVVVTGQVDSQAARRAAAAAAAAPLAANIVAEMNRDAAAPPAIEALTLTGDTGNVFEGKNIAVVRRETGAVVLVSRMSADALRAVAAGVR
jgi:hypothetical protein